MAQPIDVARDALTVALKSGLQLKLELTTLHARRIDERRASALRTIEVLDSFRKKFDRFSELPAEERRARKVLLSFESIGQQLEGVLRADDITELELSDGLPILGFTKIVDTVADESLADGIIFEVVKPGYVRGNSLIREAEVIIVKNS